MRKDVLGYNGLYQIDENQQIYRRGKTKPLTQRRHKSGYVIADLSKDGETISLYVHRIVAIAFVPNPLNLPEVNHKDGIKWHNWPDNLEWSTRKENCHHASTAGLYNKGEKHQNAKLTHLTIEIMREAIRAGYKQKDIARYFKTTQGHVSKIKRNVLWLK